MSAGYTTADEIVRLMGIDLLALRAEEQELIVQRREIDRRIEVVRTCLHYGAQLRDRYQGESQQRVPADASRPGHRIRPELQENIRCLRRQGMSIRRIASEVGVARMTAWHYARGITPVLVPGDDPDHQPHGGLPDIA